VDLLTRESVRRLALRNVKHEVSVMLPISFASKAALNLGIREEKLLSLYVLVLKLCPCGLVNREGEFSLAVMIL